MILTRTKRKTVITTVQISKPERYKPIDVRLPSNVTRITGILVTSTAWWRDAGTVTLQAYDSTDIFYMDFVTPTNIVLTDEAQMKIEDTAIDVNDLPAYIAEFGEILKKHDLYSVHYAHAGSGENLQERVIQISAEDLTRWTAMSTFRTPGRAPWPPLVQT